MIGGGGSVSDGELLAQRFHELYEELAPEYGYETRAESRRPWPAVPERNRALMVAVCERLIVEIREMIRQGL